MWLLIFSSQICLNSPCSALCPNPYSVEWDPPSPSRKKSCSSLSSRLCFWCTCCLKCSFFFSKTQVLCMLCDPAEGSPPPHSQLQHSLPFCWVPRRALMNLLQRVTFSFIGFHWFNDSSDNNEQNLLKRKNHVRPLVFYWPYNHGSVQFSHSVMSNSLQPVGLYSRWNSPGQEWVAFPFSRGSSQPRDQTQVSRIAGGFFTSWATREALCTRKWSEVAQSCPTLWDPMDCSLPGFSVHGIFQARILEWVAISFSRGSSWPRDQTQVSCIAGRRFTLWATREAPPVHKRGPLFFVSTFVPGVIIILFNICTACHSFKKFMHIILFDFSVPLLSPDP